MRGNHPSHTAHRDGAAVRCVAVGGLRADFVITAEGRVILNQHGGNALYAAAGIKIWTDGVGIVGRVGSNFPPDWLDQAQAAGFDLAGVHRLPTWQETRTFYAYRPDGRRQDTHPDQHFAALGRPTPTELEGYTSSTVDHGSPDPRPLSLTVDDFPPSYHRAGGVHVAPYDLWTHRHLVPALAQAGTPVLTLDPNYGYASPQHAGTVCALLPHVTAFLPSALEAEGLLGSTSPPEAARSFARRGARTVVIKLGQRGALVLEANRGTPRLVPAYPTRVEDPTGAGDAFCGGYLVGYLETGDPVRAAQYGTVSASFAIESRGGLATIGRTRSEAEARLQWLDTHRPPQPC
jgi:ribokinase